MSESKNIKPGVNKYSNIDLFCYSSEMIAVLHIIQFYITIVVSLVYQYVNIEIEVSYLHDNNASWTILS